MLASSSTVVRASTLVVSLEREGGIVLTPGLFRGKDDPGGIIAPATTE
jgi:hypothetical protein